MQGFRTPLFSTAERTHSPPAKNKKFPCRHDFPLPCRHGFPLLGLVRLHVCSTLVESDAGCIWTNFPDQSRNTPAFNIPCAVIMTHSPPAKKTKFPCQQDFPLLGHAFAGCIWANDTGQSHRGRTHRPSKSPVLSSWLPAQAHSCHVDPIGYK